MVEVGLISEFILALSNPRLGLDPDHGMLVFSGLGSFVSERFLPTAPRDVMPKSSSRLAPNPDHLWAGALIACSISSHLPYLARLLLCFRARLSRQRS